MSDNKKARQLDRRYISLGDVYEIAYWTAALNVTEVDLRGAIGKVGNQPANVREFLKKAVVGRQTKEHSIGLPGVLQSQTKGFTALVPDALFYSKR